MELQHVLFIRSMFTNINTYAFTKGNDFSDFERMVQYYVNKYLVECSLFEDKYLEFSSEEDFFKFKLMFDEDEFYHKYSDLRLERSKDALDAVTKQANNLNW